MAGIYLHIPFCKQACIYCNFHFSTSGKIKNEVLQAMLIELEMKQHYLNEEHIETIYFGGGTPSLLTAEEINLFVDKIQKIYPIKELKEITLEANPDDLTLNYLKALKKTPINRLSIGIQSFREQDLLFLKRVHSAKQADYAIKAAQDIGYENITIDLIYGIPNLSNSDWRANLLQMKDYNLPHFSSYALTVEDKTALNYAIQKKVLPPLEPEQAAQQFEILMEQASMMGYEHYEISNFALSRHQAIHNTNYWLGVPYLGIGPSAHSFNGTSRKWNIANNGLYTSQILKENKLLFEEEFLTPTQQANEYIMTSLRTSWGLNITHIQNKWVNINFESFLKKATYYIEKGWMVNKNQHLILTYSGKLFADKIASEMFF